MNKANDIPDLSVEEKMSFLAKVDNSRDENKCWPWKASKLSNGYGQLTIKQMHFLAHRISWFIYCGRIPSGLNVLHKCDNPSCVNPNHLFLGTQKENMKDKVDKGRAYTGIHKGEKNPANKLTADDVRDMRSKNGTLKEIAKEYGVSFGLIGHIKSKRLWKHL